MGMSYLLAGGVVGGEGGLIFQATRVCPLASTSKIYTPISTSPKVSTHYSINSSPNVIET